MLRVLIEKECKAILLSPRFLGTFVVSSALILLSAEDADEAEGATTPDAETQNSES